MRLIFLEPPGAGKGTQAEILARELKIPHISTGDILRQAIKDKTLLGIQAKNYLEAGELVPDHLIMALIRERLGQTDASAGWILDEFPRNLAQVEAFEQLLQILGPPYPQVVNFRVNIDSLILRMLQRGRQDDNETVMIRRLAIYEEQTTPVISFYRKLNCLTELDGNLTPAEVTASLRSQLFPATSV
jgi:adenylate kinase